VGENESVKIRLNLRAGEIRSTFITESPELREALQKAWPDFTANHRSQGIRFGESQFQDSFARQQDATSDQGSQRQHQTETFASDIPSKQQTKNSPRSVHKALGNSQSSSSSIHLWA
jgi:flagellar hook-length control protein FliK